MRRLGPRAVSFTAITNLIVMLAVVAWALPARADWLTVPVTGATLNHQQRTHILIVSRGNDLGFAPQLAALTKAKKLNEVYPDDQVVIFTHAESIGNLSWLRQIGFLGTAITEGVMRPTLLTDQLVRFSKIASLNTFGHSAIPEGIFLGAEGDTDIRFYPSSKQYSRLKGHFTSDAFATLNGCNAGHQLAPMLSHLWKIPVAAALVGTHFEVLKKDGQFGLLGPEEQWSKTTQSSFRQDKPCLRGCVRMRPDIGLYNGHYGKYLQGLPIYKFFCVGINEELCHKAMARSMLSNVTSRALGSRPTYEEYARSVHEWLCPVANANNRGENSRSSQTSQATCMQALSAIDLHVDLQTNRSHNGELSLAMRSFSPFFGPTMQCDFVSCYADRKCIANDKNAWDCAKNEEPPLLSTTFVDEYLHYRQGYQLLFAHD